MGAQDQNSKGPLGSGSEGLLNELHVSKDMGLRRISTTSIGAGFVDLNWTFSSSPMIAIIHSKSYTHLQF
jgi:hypothetical protein